MRRAFGVLVCVLLLPACSPKTDDTQAAATTRVDTLTRRQKDSILARSGIPMTGAIGKATGAADAASAQAAAHDSVLNGL
ncbi:MAG: hypothetical protein EXR95_10625 [Gemmatimonadetes bacterium]|nr:hypothetical protein [Gemmatimonadota bacterium]